MRHSERATLLSNKAGCTLSWLPGTVLLQSCIGSTESSQLSDPVEYLIENYPVVYRNAGSKLFPDGFILSVC